MQKSQPLSSIYLYGMVWNLEELWPQLSCLPYELAHERDG